MEQVGEIAVPAKKSNQAQYLIPVGERVRDEGGDLVNELVGPPGVKDPGEPAHLGASPLPPRLLEPVVHDAALPRVVDGPRRGHRGVERPPRPGPEAAGGGGGGGAGEGGDGEGREEGAGGEERVVGEERRGERDEDQRRTAAAARRGHGVVLWSSSGGTVRLLASS
jgi:hypothetical protein